MDTILEDPFTREYCTPALAQEGGYTVVFQVFDLPPGTYSYAWQTGGWTVEDNPPDNCSMSSDTCIVTVSQDPFDDVMTVVVTNTVTGVSYTLSAQVEIPPVCGTVFC